MGRTSARVPATKWLVILIGCVRAAAPRSTQVSVSEARLVQPDCTRPHKRSVLEVAVRQVRPAQDEILVHTAKRGAAALDRPALIAGRALLEHIHGARRGWGRRRAGRRRRRDRTLHRCELPRLRQVVEEPWRLWIVGYEALDARLREAVRPSQDTCLSFPLYAIGAPLRSRSRRPCPTRVGTSTAATSIAALVAVC